MLSDNKEKVQFLLERYYHGNISMAEVEELSLLLKDDQNDDLTIEVLTAMAADVTPMYGEEVAMERMVERLKDVMAVPTPVWKRPVIRWSAAAAVALLVGTGIYLQRAGNRPMVARHYSNDLQPGRDKATLTLDDGSKINLDGLGNGTTVMQQGGDMVKTSQGSIAYNNSRDDGKAVQYNILTTPRGGQFKLALPDGTMVWLNAGSSLRFPIVFTGDNRTVELTGEAYFDVAKQASRPFIVKMRDGLKVEVLGTEFNASGYLDDDAASATLVTGAVRVGNAADVRVLKPGQQALAGNNGIALNASADIAGITAWKNGLFVFNDADIETIMKQLSRWYDLEVVYEGKVKEYFNGTIPRDVPLSKVLELLELTGLVHFKIEGRKVTVTS